MFRSLKTRSLEIALAKRDAELGRERKRVVSGALLFSSLCQQYTHRVNSNPDLAASSKAYRLETLAAISATWPDLHSVSQITDDAIIVWAGKVREKYSATRYNGILETMRGVLDVATKQGQWLVNPIDDALKQERIKRAPIINRERKLPTAKQLADLFADLQKAHQSRCGLVKNAGQYLIRFLCYFPLRIGTARQLKPEHVDRENHCFTIPGELIKKGIKGTIYRPPIIPQMDALLAEMDKEFGKDRAWLLPVKDARDVLRRACARVGIPRLTHHTFRHIFTTSALHTTDVATVAKWRGDKDGGAMLLKVYSHLLDDHSRKMARRVRV